MPVRQMKVKSTTTCAREGSCLQVYRRSSKKCKKSSSPVQVTYQAADLDTPDQTDHNGYIQEHGGEVTPCQEVSCSEENPGNHNSSLSDEASDRSVKMEEDYNRFLESQACSLALEAIYNSFMGCNHLHPSYIEEESEDTIEGTKVAGDKSNNVNHSSSTNQTTYALDSNTAELSTDLMGELEDMVNYNYYAYYEFATPTLTHDINDIKMFSSLEETTEAADDFYAGSVDDFLQNSDDSWFHQVIHQAKPWSQELDVDNILVNCEEVEYSDPQSFITSVPDPSDESDSLPPLVSKETRKKKQVTLVLDLDETLVHSTLEPCDNADFTIQVYFDMKEHTVYVRKRPFLLTFLERVAELFDIIVFTASQSIYAEKLLDVLDPDKKFFSRRVYRESCIFSDGGYTKDLTVLGIDLAKVVIVDNTPQVFRLQADNGIPIKSWFDDPSDRALMSLLPFLETLVYSDDVRPIIANTYGAKD